MTTEVRNFACFEQQPLTSVTATASAATHFTTAAGQSAKQARVVNYGSAGVQLAFGGSTVAAVATAFAAGTTQYYIMPGEDIVVEKDAGAAYFSAITDSGSSSIIVHAGEGS